MLDFGEIDAANAGEAGGKGANLGELARIDGVRVPAGFCVTTDAYRRVAAAAPEVAARLEPLVSVDPDDHAAVRTRSAAVRAAVEDVAMPGDLEAAIGAALARLGEDGAYAVRSSATAEDLPTASFAGQQDSYLGIVGVAAVLRHVRRCWASLFTERAVAYRRRNGIDDRAVRMAVVVQRMVDADAAGMLFTADPVTSNRKVATVEAVWGLGEALVSGQVTGDVYTVRDDQVVTAEVAAGARPALTDAQAVRLVRLGRRIEAHFGRPQDIEWARVGEDFHIVQSRPITTLFPIPETADGEHHVYLSVGHQQMMTDAMKPLGLSFWQMTTPRPMHEAGGRLFVDVAPLLAAPAARKDLRAMMGKSDPLFLDALDTVLGGEAGTDDEPDADTGAAPEPEPIEAGPELVTELIRAAEESAATLRREIRDLSGTELLDFVRDDIAELRRVLFDPRGIRLIMAAMDAALWLNDRLAAWLGERNAADALTQSVDHNVTSEMGLALLDVADAVRPYPEVVAYLRRAADDGRDGDAFLDELAGLPGGAAARDAFRAYLDAYGMRCAGEIDITRTRWSERPVTLVPTLLGDLQAFEPGAGRRRFAEGREEARRTEEDVLARLRALPGGERKAAETKRMIDRVRAFAGYREYPKYGMVTRYLVYKKALLREAGRLVGSGVLRAPDDIFYLRLAELREVVRTGKGDAELVRERRAAFRSYETLTPPRVLTSEGEAATGRYRRDDAPPGALPGLPVSAGLVEGRARVVTDMATADLEPGDILVTTFTDPSWTPLFVTAAGLVTEVGGLMTHGAVVAREYGLPAVVGVPRATRLIPDGHRIRVHGTEGYVELLD
ncbi:MAG TPA: rifamycin-inactivating phosphotransferase [Streptosporangiaceae bacterium]